MKYCRECGAELEEEKAGIFGVQQFSKLQEANKNKEVAQQVVDQDIICKSFVF